MILFAALKKINDWLKIDYAAGMAITIYILHHFNILEKTNYPYSIQSLILPCIISWIVEVFLGIIKLK